MAESPNPTDSPWHREFRDRMDRFERSRRLRRGEAAVSIKIRVQSGCFHREHSPRAYELIDEALRHLDRNSEICAFEEHESGPEILALVTAGVSLAAALVGLTAAIINARSAGIRKGDRPSEPLELIVRRIYRAGEYREETVFRVPHQEALDEAKMKRQVEAALRKLLADDPVAQKKAKAQLPKERKKKS